MSPTLAPTPATNDARLKALLRKCKDDPVLFARAVLGWSTPHKNALWKAQREVLGLICRHKSVVVPAANSVGKTRAAAAIVLWWLHTRPGSRVIVVAPTHQILGECLFTELRTVLANAKFELGGEITQSPKAAPQTYCVLRLKNWGWWLGGLLGSFGAYGGAP